MRQSTLQVTNIVGAASTAPMIDTCTVAAYPPHDGVITEM
jgi:hypothetical protein